MKSILVIIVILLVVSCSSTKKVVKNQPEPTKEVTVVNETTTTNEVPENLELKLKQQTEKAVVQKDSIEDLGFSQIVSKHKGYLHDLFDQLLEEHVSSDGKVNYKGFKNSYKDLLGYINVLTILYPKLDKLSREEKLAYWINAYNALTIDLILRNYPLNSIKDIKNPWDQRLWEFGDKWLNLNDIEHQILRKMNEPRIHFAIVCASESCPRLLNEAFTAHDLETQLTNATKAFLLDTSKNEISENNIKLSKIFKWFAKDFKTNGSLIDFLNQYAEISISDKAKKSFKTYDWSLNN